MNTLIGFFTLRPIFTLWGLRVVWFLVVAQQAVTLVLLTGGSIGAMVVGVLFSSALYLVLVRLLIEVAMAVLINSSTLQRPAVDVAGE